MQSTATDREAPPKQRKGRSGSAEEQRRAWQKYRRTRDPKAREALVLSYISLVKYVAGRLAIGLPPLVQTDDLIGSGIVGLLDAIEKYDTQRDTKFETYAVSRIRGAMLDELRSLDWISRSTRRKGRMLEEAYARLEKELGRAASDDEVAKELKISKRVFYQLLKEVSCTSLASLDELMHSAEGEQSWRVMDTVTDRGAETPSTLLEMEEVRDLLASSIQSLPDRERLVIALYYYEELTLKEIGRILGVTESRISQVHTKAILRLRGKLRSRCETLVTVMGEGHLGRTEGQESTKVRELRESAGLVLAGLSAPR